MADLSMRCPRCKQEISDSDPGALADALVAHVEAAHGHAPPREHVLARIERHSRTS